MNASASGYPVSVLSVGPRPRPGGLHRSSTPWVVGWGLSLGPWPLLAVLTMKWAPWVRLAIAVAQRISLIVHWLWVSLVKNRWILSTPMAFRAFAVYATELESE